MIIAIALGKAYAISGLTTRDDDLFDSQFAGSLDDIVSTQHVALEALIIRDEHVPRIRREMDDGIDWAYGDGFGVTGVRVVIYVEVGSKSIENLTGVGEVCLEGVDGGVREWNKVEVENRVTFGEKVGDYVTACFS